MRRPEGSGSGATITRTVLRETIGADDAPPAAVPSLAGDPRAYAGQYDNPFAAQRVRPGTKTGELVLEHHARAPEPGRWAPPAPPPIRLGFYGPDRVVALAPHLLAGLRGDFGRDARGDVAWLRWGGRLAPRIGD